MTAEASLAACEEIVRRADPDRYLSALFAPAERRPVLFALYAFNHELARVGEVAREPIMGQIRLEWWREAVAEARAGTPRAHDVARGLAELFARVDLPPEPFDAMIDAREFDTTHELFIDMRALVEYADASSGSLMRIASRILCGSGAADGVSHEAGVAYGLTGILRAIPHRAARRKLFLPADVLAGQGIAADEVLVGNVAQTKLHAAVEKVAEVARAHYLSAHARKIEDASLPALLPAALVPLYLKRLARPGFDPLRDLVEAPAFRKQIAFLRAVFAGRI